MDSFQAQKGFAHFVFANEQDHYLLPSLVRLDLNGYLYCRLKRRGYEGVYFISGAQGEYELSVYDQSSRELFQKYGKKASVFKGIFGGEEDEQARTCRLSGPTESARRLNAMLKKGRNQAFVFRMDTFREIFSGQRQELEEFSRVGNRSLEHSGNILVLLMPMENGGIAPYFMDPQGVFAQCGEQELCPEVGQLQKEGIREQLEEVLNERLVTLSSFSYDKVYLVARWLYLTAKPDWTWQDQDVRDLAVFLYSWYASPNLRAEAGPLLSENESRRFDLLLRELTDAATWQSLCGFMESLREKAGEETLEQYLRRAYHPGVPDPVEVAACEAAEPEHTRQEEEPLRNI